MTPQEQPDSQAANDNTEKSYVNSMSSDSQAGDELREDLKLELLDWQGDILRGNLDIPFDEITRRNEQNLNVTLDNLEKLFVAYAERLAAERAIEELKELPDPYTPDDFVELIAERIAALSATLTKGGQNVNGDGDERSSDA